MTECVPNFEFAPQRTFTIGDAARAASPEYVSQHWAKWQMNYSTNFYSNFLSFCGRILPGLPDRAVKGFAAILDHAFRLGFDIPKIVRNLTFLSGV
jgi:hypothetical protein